MPNLEKDFSYVDEWKSMWEPDLEAIAYNGATCDPTRVDPKVLEWVRKNCASHKPRFIKIINNTSSAYGWRGRGGRGVFKIGVPRPFVRDNYKELGRVVTLESGISHKRWKVSFGAAKKNSSWLQGWRRVADDNSLRPGDVIIFVLVSHSLFRFHLFDENGNITGTNRPKQSNARNNNVRVKAEPSDTFHSHPDYAVTDSEAELSKHKRLRRLFDPDLAIVKIEPGLFQKCGASPEPQAPSWSIDLPNEQIIEPARCEKSTVPRGFGAGVISSPDSELTVTDGEATIPRGETKREKNSAPNIGQSLADSPQIALNIVDTCAEKSISTARCTKTTSRQRDHEGSEDGPVKRKLEFKITEKKSMKEGMFLAYTGMISQQTTTSSDQVREAPPQGANANAPAQKLSINPLAYFIKSKRRMTTPTERKQARDMAEAHADNLEGRFRFVVVMSGVQVYTDFHLPLSARFVSESGFPTSLTRSSLVDWAGGKSWEIYSRVNSCNEVSFHRKYWGVFSLEHFLEDGDVCVFELKNEDTFTISVRIFRVLPLPSKYLSRTVTFHDHYELRPKPKS